MATSVRGSGSIELIQPVESSEDGRIFISVQDAEV
jgi:hypothetical protein